MLPWLGNYSCFAKRDFMMHLSYYKQADSIDTFNTKSRYLYDILLNINNINFDNMVT